MEGLALALWTLLVSAEFGGGSKVPMPSTNLSCYQCFKVKNASLCGPKACSPGDKVCVSNVVVYYIRTRQQVQMSKRCALRCPNGNSESWWAPAPDIQAKIMRQCCAGDLCNAAPTSHPGAGTLPEGLLLRLGLGLLWALL